MAAAIIRQIVNNADDGLPSIYIETVLGSVSVTREQLRAVAGNPAHQGKLISACAAQLGVSLSPGDVTVTLGPDGEVEELTFR